MQKPTATGHLLVPESRLCEDVNAHESILTMQVRRPPSSVRLVWNPLMHWRVRSCRHALPVSCPACLHASKHGTTRTVMNAISKGNQVCICVPVRQQASCVRAEVIWHRGSLVAAAPEAQGKLQQLEKHQHHGTLLLQAACTGKAGNAITLLVSRIGMKMTADAADKVATFLLVRAGQQRMTRCL